MNLNLFDKAKIAYQIMRSDFRAPNNVKSLPFPWPGLVQGEPQWNPQNYAAYATEGYSQNALVYAAIMYKVRSMMTIPLRAYTGDPQFPELLPPEHPLSQRIANPNDYQTWVEFHSQNMVYQNLSGNAYVWRNPVTEDIISFRPDRTSVVPNSGPFAGIHHFLYVPKGKEQKDGIVLLPEDTVHIRMPNPLDEFEGMGYGLAPPIAAAQSVDVDNMVTAFLKLFFDKGSVLTGLLSFDLPLTAPVVDKIIENWNKKYGGYQKWGVGVMDRGGKYQRIGLTFEEMGFTDLDARNECRILMAFGIPPILVGSRVGLASSTYSNYEGARRAAWEDTLFPEARMYEAEYQHLFNTETEFVKFDFSQVPALQKDLPTIVRSAYTLYQMGVPANTALAAVGLNLGEIPNGDKPFSGAEPPPTGQGGQGPRSQDSEAWGMNSMVCDKCGGELKEVASGILSCQSCGRLSMKEGG